MKSTTSPSSASKAPKQAQEDAVGGGGSSSWTAPTQIQSMDGGELQRLKGKIYIYPMLEEVSLLSQLINHITTMARPNLSKASMRVYSLLGNL
jgi:hypothetical protein